MDEVVPVEPNTEQSTRKTVPPKRWPVLLLTLGAILLLGFYSHFRVAGLVSPDAMDYAQIGRNLLAGHGLTTCILRPLALTDSSNPLAQPDLTHGPLYPFLLALAFGIAGVKDSVAIAMSGLFYVLTIPALYALGRRLFSPQLGLFAALIFLTNNAILDAAISGTPTTLLLLLATCLFLALFHAARGARKGADEATAKVVKGPFVLAGLLSGLLYLTDPILVWMLPVLVVAVPLLLPARQPTRQAQAAGCFMLPLALLALPCMFRFGLMAGNPLLGLRGAELWMGTKTYPGFLAYRLTPDALLVGLNSVKGIGLKVLLSGAGALTSLLHLPAAWVLLFGLPGLFFGFADPALGRLRTIVFACLISVVGGSLFLVYDPAVLMVVFPGLLVFALHYLLHLVGQARLPQVSRVLVVGLFGLALLSPMAASLVTTSQPATIAQAAVAKSLSDRSRPDEVVFSDQPWIVAWYADRPSVWIPVNETKMAAIRKQFVSARWLFLTPQAQSLSPEWNQAFEALMRWDMDFQATLRNGTAPPASYPIARNQSPITEALEGFAPVAPMEAGLPSAIVAMVPASDRPDKVSDRQTSETLKHKQSH